jgi:hypothetical protein
MHNRLSIAALTFIVLAACAGRASASQLDADADALKERIAQAQDERKSHGKGSVVHDLITLRIAIQEQTLAMLEQRRLAGKARVKLSYRVDGKPYHASRDAAADAKRLEEKIREVRAGREYDLQQARESGEPFKPLYTMTAAVRAIHISQLEYRLAANRYGFPPYYVPFHPPAEGVTPPQVIEVPAGSSAVIQ